VPHPPLGKTAEYDDYGSRERVELRSGAGVMAALHPRRILVFRPGAIGDTLLSFPALLALRRRFPGAEVWGVGNAAALRLAAAHGIIDRAEAFGAAWVSDLFGDQPVRSAWLATFDLGIVWMHTREAAADLAARLAAAGVGTVLPLVSFPAPGSRCHLADHLLATLEPLGIAGPRPDVSLALPGDGERLVILHPGAGGRHKRWPAAHFACLADRFANLGLPIAVTRGPADAAAVTAFLDLVRRARPIVLEELDLVDLAAILGRARLFIGNDSGITHLAALAGAPTVAIFGPYDPVYWAPLGRHVAVLDAGLRCPHRTDPRDGCRTCDMLAGLGVEVVWQAAVEMRKMVS